MHAKRPTTRPPRGGFTLVELVLVIVIVGVVGAIAVPRFAQASSRQQLEAAAKRVASDLERAQHHARSTSNRAALNFDLNASGYTFAPASGTGFTVDLSRSPYQVTITKASFGDANAVSFNGFGVPSSAGNIVLSSSAGTATVWLDATGRVTR